MVPEVGAVQGMIANAWGSVNGAQGQMQAQQQIGLPGLPMADGTASAAMDGTAAMPFADLMTMPSARSIGFRIRRAPQSRG